MQGAGQVRSLREAATLNSTLAALLGQFAVATDRATQQGLIDGILKQWSNTSTMAATFTGAYAGHALTVNVQGIAAGSATYPAWVDRLTILERFNGRTFNAVPAGTAAVTVNLWTTSQALLQQSYDHLKASVYQSLALQTWLRPYLDKIGLTVTATGVKLDFSALRTEFDARFAADQASTLADLVDFSLGTRQRLRDSGWDSTREITRYLDQVSITPAIQASLVSAGILVDGAANWNAGGTGADDLMVGHGGNEAFSGGDGQDTLYGGAGNDNLYGGGGNDMLYVGTGNDVLDGGAGNDTYVFRRGNGFDTIKAYDSAAGRVDTLKLDALTATDMRLEQLGSDLGFVIKASGE